MGIFNRIRDIFLSFVRPADTPCEIDAGAYHSQPDERELRFSPSSVLRRHY